MNRKQLARQRKIKHCIYIIKNILLPFILALVVIFILGMPDFIADLIIGG